MSDMVNMPVLLSKGTKLTVAQARNAIMKGEVYVDDENIGAPHVVMPRGELANAVVRCRRETFQINEFANAIKRRQERPQARIA